MDPKPKTAQEIAEEARVRLEEQAALERSSKGQDQIKAPTELPSDADTPEYKPTTPEETRPNQVIEEEGLARKNNK